MPRCARFVDTKCSRNLNLSKHCRGKKMSWLLLTIVIPVVMPLILLFIVSRSSPGVPPEVRELMRPASFFKDAQLSWIAFALILSAVLELPEAKGAYAVLSGRNYPVVVLALWTGALFSAMLGFAGPTFMVPADVPDGVHRLKHFRVMVISIIQTLGAAAIFAAIHFAGVGRMEECKRVSPEEADTHAAPASLVAIPVASAAASNSSASSKSGSSNLPSAASSSSGR